MFNRCLRAAALALGLFAWLADAAAQQWNGNSQTAVPGFALIIPGVGPVSASNPLNIQGTFTATLSGFAPTPSYSQLAVTTASARVALPTGAVVIVYNTGASAADVTLGNSSVTATTSGDVIQPSSWMAFTVGANGYLAGITASGTASLNISGGSGLPTGAGGGSGGGGGSTPTGTAGSPTASVVSVQGVSSGTVIPVVESSLPAFAATPTFNLGTIAGVATATNQPTAAAQGSTTSGQTGNLDLAAVSTTAPSYTNGQSNSLSLTPAGALRVDGSAITQPVTAASLPLPSGAAQSANQPTAATSGSTTSGQTGTLQMGAVTTSGPSYTNGQTAPVSLDPSGNVRMNCVSGCSSSGGSSLADGGAFSQGTTSATVVSGLYATSVTNLTAGQAGALRATADRKLMVDTPNIEAGLGAATAPTYGVAILGVYNASAPSVSNGQSVALQVTAGGSLHATIDNVQASATPFSNIVANNTTAVVVKSAAGTLYSLDIDGIGSTTLWVKFYDATSATCGSGTPKYRYLLPANSTATNGAGHAVPLPPQGITFATGITYCATTGIADTDATAPAAASFVINGSYL